MRALVKLIDGVDCALAVNAELRKMVLKVRNPFCLLNVVVEIGTGDYLVGMRAGAVQKWHVGEANAEAKTSGPCN